MARPAPDLRGSLRRLTLLGLGFRAAAEALTWLLPPETFVQWPLFGLSTHPGRSTLALALMVEGLRGAVLGPEGGSGRRRASATGDEEPPQGLEGPDSNARLAPDPPEEVPRAV